MGQIVIVRHGQASWGAADYDVLSPLGEEQAAAVGSALADLHPDVLVHGSMQRQRRTAELAAAAAGWALTATVDPRWNEMDHLAVLAAQPTDFEGEPDKRQFQAWFEAATDRWTSSEFDHEYDETYPAFRARAKAALAELAEVGTAVVVTSGGPISVVASELLEGGLSTYRRLTPVIINASITTVVSGARGLTLVGVNEHRHLPARLVTYR
jgi:broad specificity phosphatase PhoE